MPPRFAPYPVSLTVAISKAMANQLANAAEETQVPRSELARRALERALPEVVLEMRELQNPDRLGSELASEPDTAKARLDTGAWQHGTALEAHTQHQHRDG